VGTERPLPTNREWHKFRVLSEMLCLSPVRVKIGPAIARIGRKYVSNRLEADAGSEGLWAENDQPH